MPNKYLQKIASSKSFEKTASISSYAQSGFTNLALGTVPVVSKTLSHIGKISGKEIDLGKRTGQGIANHFAMGVKQVYPKGVAITTKNALKGSLAPDIRAAEMGAHMAGGKMNKYLSKMTPREQAGLRMMSQGRFDTMHKHGLTESPKIRAVSRALRKHTGVDLVEEVRKNPAVGKELHETFSDPKNVILNKVVSNISRGKVHPKAVPGRPSGTGAAIGNAVAGGVELGVAGFPFGLGGLVSPSTGIGKVMAFDPGAKGVAAKVGKKYQKYYSNVVKGGIETGTSKPKSIMRKLEILTDKPVLRESKDFFADPVASRLSREANAVGKAVRTPAK